MGKITKNGNGLQPPPRPEQLAAQADGGEQSNGASNGRAPKRISITQRTAIRLRRAASAFTYAEKVMTKRAKKVDGFDPAEKLPHIVALRKGAISLAEMFDAMPIDAAPGRGRSLRIKDTDLGRLVEIRPKHKERYNGLLDSLMKLEITGFRKNTHVQLKTDTGMTLLLPRGHFQLAASDSPDEEDSDEDEDDDDLDEDGDEEAIESRPSA